MKIDRARVGLYGVLLLIVGTALGLRYWSDTHLPPVHALKLTISERGIPREPVYSVDSFAPGELVARDNMKEMAQGRPIEGGSTLWELMKVEQRTVPGAAWMPLKPSDGVEPPTLPIKLMENEPSLPYYRLNNITSGTGEWKVTVRASRSYYDAETKEEWVGKVEHTVTRRVKEDLVARAAAERREKEAAYRAARGLPAPTPLPPPGVHPLDPNKDYVANIQWSRTDTGPWRDVPQKGQKGFPLTLAADEVTGFRATKKNLRAPWPDWTGDEDAELSSILGWSGDIVTRGGLIGEKVWIQPGESCLPSVNASDLRTISVGCGNTVKRQIRVLPPTQ